MSTSFATCAAPPFAICAALGVLEALPLLLVPALFILASAFCAFLNWASALAFWFRVVALARLSTAMSIFFATFAAPAGGVLEALPPVLAREVPPLLLDRLALLLRPLKNRRAPFLRPLRLRLRLVERLRLRLVERLRLRLVERLRLRLVERLRLRLVERLVLDLCDLVFEEAAFLVTRPLLDRLTFLLRLLVDRLTFLLRPPLDFLDRFARLPLVRLILASKYLRALNVAAFRLRPPILSFDLEI